MSTCLLIVGVIFGAFLLISACNQDPDISPSEDHQSPRAVRVALPETGSINQTINYVGTVQSQREAQVLGRIAATVVEIYVDEGDQTTPQSPLLRMQSPELDAQLERLHAEVERARSENEYLCQTATTDRNLADIGAMPTAAADASESKCRTSEQGLLAAQAALREANVRRGYLQETGPFDGVVLQQMIEVGEYITPGRPLFTIGSHEKDIRIMVTEDDLAAGLELGQEVLVHTESGSARSHITQLAMVARGPGRTIEVRVALPEELQQKMRPGMSVDIAFVFAESEAATTVAAESILETETGPVVFAVDDNHLRKLTVETGIRTAERVEILSDLPPNLSLVIGQLGALRDKEEVYPVELSRGQ